MFALTKTALVSLSLAASLALTSNAYAAGNSTPSPKSVAVAPSGASSTGSERKSSRAPYMGTAPEIVISAKRPNTTVVYAEADNRGNGSHATR